MVDTTKCSPTANWSDKDWDNFKTWISGVLKETIVTVTFMKKDGTERVMKCTLDPSMLPVTESKESTKKIPENSLSVFDTELKEWRSFIIKSVKHIQFTIE